MTKTVTSPLKKKKNIILYNSKGETRIFLFLSFIIPFLVMWAMFYHYEVHPFGDKQILVTDLWHQYFPFFKEEHDKLQNLSSLLYSWNTGLGTNFLSVMSYYAASPLNLLAVFFPLELSRDALTLFLTIKIGCAGLFFAIFLKHIFRKNDITIVGFSMCYALCAYIMGYYWNLIWIDTVALLPLVVLGTVMLVKEGKFKLYAISLALSLVTNFYIGLFTCIFTVMVFGGAIIINWNGFKHAFVRLGQIIGATIIGIGMGAFILLPAFLALQLTNSVDNTFPDMITYYETWYKMISSVIGFHEPTAKEGLPNFYCGMIGIILLGVFLVNRKIKIREKIVTAVYLAFIVVSCNMNVLNYIWHGFHFTNMIPYRFSFLFSFMLIVAAYRAFTVITEEIDIFDIIPMIVMTVSIALIAYENQEIEAIKKSVVVCAIYIFVMLIYERKIINKKVMGALVSIVCAVEMGWNAYIGVTTVTTTTYSIYPKNEAEVVELLAARENEDSDFYRTEFTSTYTINDPALYGVKGVSQFSSTANVNVSVFLADLGIQGSAAGNRYYYTHSTPILNSFLNIKYLIAQDGFMGDEAHNDFVIQSGSVEMYENNAYLPIAFVADSDILGYKGMGATQADNQNQLFRLATGTSTDILTEIPVKNVGHKGIDVRKTDNGQYSYDPDDDEQGDHYVKYNFEAINDGPMYVSIKFDNCDTGFKVKLNGNTVHSFSNQKYKTITPIGDFAAGDVVSVFADIKEETSGKGEIHAYQLNDEAFRAGIEKLSKGGMTVTSYDDTEISGTFTAENDGVLYTSIPYDGGWTAYVDGEETEVTSIKDAFLCIPVIAGNHEITLKYSPPGFVAGVAISAASILILAAIWILMKKYPDKFKVNVSCKKASKEIQAEASEGEVTADTETAETISDAEETVIQTEVEAVQEDEAQAVAKKSTEENTDETNVDNA